LPGSKRHYIQKSFESDSFIMTLEVFLLLRS
jgi:hypothetical protein